MAETTRAGQERGQQIGETFGELSEQIAALVREELERARGELEARAREAAKGSGLLALAGAFGVASAGTALSLPVLVLRRMLPAELTALAAGGLYGGAAFLLGRRALARLEAAAPDAVQQRVEARKEDLSDSLRERVPGSES